MARGRELWDDFDRARYTPALSTAEEARRHGDALQKILNDLEALWKK